MVQKDGFITLSSGFHYLKVTYFDGTGDAELFVAYQGIDTANQISFVTFAELFRPTSGCICRMGSSPASLGGNYFCQEDPRKSSSCVWVNHGPCEECVAGTYKDINGSAACTPCPQGKFSTATGATNVETCRGCPSNANSNDGAPNITHCVCNPGFTGPDGGPCEACATGTYKDLNGTAECSHCPAGTFSPETGKTSDSACHACPSHSYSAPGTPDPSMLGLDQANKCALCVCAFTRAWSCEAQWSHRQQDVLIDAC